MDSLPFIVPIAGLVLLVNGLWTCCQGRHVRRLEARVGLLEEQVAVAVRVPPPQQVMTAYYPPMGYQRPMVATAPPGNFITI
jgi:hypothetical protein